jgi:hypothetical protein
MVEAGARLQRPVWLRALREHGIAEDTAQAICDRIADSYVPWQEETFPGLLTNVISGRIASKFDLHGINHTTDAACASSLAALYTGMAELSLGPLRSRHRRRRRHDERRHHVHLLLPDPGPVPDRRLPPVRGRRRRHDARRGPGPVRPQAGGRRRARRGQDLRGRARHRRLLDGRGAAIYAPVAAGQARALRRAYEASGYGPETVELVEAHGTGTGAGDAAEFTALREVFDATGRPDRQWCALGSVKSQIGHTKSTAGAAGLLKAVLALHHRVLPPTIKVGRPHPDLDLERSPFHVNTATRPWDPPARHALPAGRRCRASASAAPTSTSPSRSTRTTGRRGCRPRRPNWCC